MDGGNGSLSGTVRDVHQLLANHLHQEMGLMVAENGTKGVVFSSGVFQLHLGTS